MRTLHNAICNSRAHQIVLNVNALAFGLGLALMFARLIEYVYHGK